MENNELERYGTVSGWAKHFGLQGETVREYAKNIQPIPGKDKLGRVWNFFSESEIHAAIERLMELPRANEKGFFIAEEELYGSVNAWARELGLARTAIYRTLAATGIKGITAKTVNNSIVENGYFTGKQIRSACAHLLKEVPTENETRFIILEGKRYGSCTAWAKELGIHKHTISNHLRDAPAITGKTRNGAILENAFYAESDVLQRCADFADKNMPQADENGFFTVDTPDRGFVRYGTCYAWGQKMGGVALDTIKKRVKNKSGLTGKDSIGRVLTHAFFPDYLIQETCADLQDVTPRAGEDGFIMLEGERHATSNYWAAILDLEKETVRRRTEELTAITGRHRNGRSQIYNFFAEKDIRRVCADLLEDLPKADNDGFLVIPGDPSKRYGSKEAWSTKLHKGVVAIANRLKEQPSIRGRKSNGKIGIFYEEHIVMLACADLLTDELNGE